MLHRPHHFTQYVKSDSLEITSQIQIRIRKMGCLWRIFIDKVDSIRRLLIYQFQFTCSVFWFCSQRVTTTFHQSRKWKKHSTPLSFSVVKESMKLCRNAPSASQTFTKNNPDRKIRLWKSARWNCSSRKAFGLTNRYSRSRSGMKLPIPANKVK